jgi:hypothetical protein
MERKTWEMSRATEMEKFNDLRLKIYKNGPFNIHLKVKRPDTPLVEGNKEKKWGQFYIFNVMTKSKISFRSTKQYSRLFGK